MRIEGRLIKSGTWWAVEVPLLFIFTQAKTKAKAYEMAKDAIEYIVDEKGFEVTVYPGPDHAFSVGSNQEALLMAFVLKQQRLHRHLSVRDVMKKMGSSSPAAYSRYEQGDVKPSLDKFTQLLRAIDDKMIPVLKVI